jgi:hypothetical protein
MNEINAKALTRSVQLLAPIYPLLPLLAAHDIRRFVDAARSLAGRDLRIRTQRAAAIDLAVGRMRRHECGGFVPCSTQCSSAVTASNPVGARTAGAVHHAG